MFTLTLIIISLAVFFSYQIARMGAKRHIGFNWAFTVSLVASPILGLVLVLLSKKLDKPIKKTHLIIKILAVVLIIWGALYVLSSGLGMLSSQSQKRTENNQEQSLNVDIPQRVGWLLAGGVLTVFIDAEAYNTDVKYQKRHSVFTVGFWLILIGAYLIRKKRKPLPPKPGFSNVPETRRV